MRIINFIKSLYLGKRVFYVLAVLIVLFLFSYWVHVLYPVALVGLFLLAIAAVFDSILLFKKKDGILATRELPEKFSNSDLNEVPLSIQNKYGFKIAYNIIDEIPVQFQKRDFLKSGSIPARAKKLIIYQLRPVDRGVYTFGKLNIYVSSPLNFVKRRFSFGKDQTVKVYPSFVQMKKYAFLAIDNKLTQFGLKKIRRIGHTMEFEQIKDYVSGDDVRTINWKATAKRGNLMVNQFQDEKSQPVYSIIDASRVMKMPFEGLTLLDYAINSALAFSNIALKKNDKTGLLTFSNTIHNHLAASSKKTHLNTILEVLYSIKTNFLDSDFGRLYAEVKRKITHRSLLLLYTNFEHLSALERQLPYLKGLAQKHVLVVIFFENTELDNLISKKATSTPEIYHKTIAQKMDYDKKLMVKELEKHGIQAVLTKPEDLSVKTINKYLEIKARGII
ncbi:putative protein (DUF58 family) [Leeuwenhoekiella polynyae]|uniref:DUF58 domain-containing protein n=1 Tax=Leeuwenhoekiella polynyae TaxID=1550906 RepID=A0A4Q0P586_9FLAO|nr:DUF58 domain-containing protein [Leeuwenhoekiella polynyae]AOE10747.1 cell division protein DivIC (FtsB), stabilizes FtsL against RasP cleavage [uncultured bacterium]RXG21777.1 putative protein (DUF58 family) [Leeuwenhoekiella polynyae]